MNTGRMILPRLLPGERRDELLADLAEEYDLRRVRNGVRSASSWYLWQILRSIPPLALRPLHHCREEQTIEIARQWAGRAFFLFAAGWIACVVWLMQPSQFGAATLVYPARVEPPCDCWNRYEHKFFIVALGPPLSVIFVSLTWIAMIERRRRILLS